MEKIGLIRQLALSEIEFALDLGCGRGDDTIYLASLGYIVSAIDKESYFNAATVIDIRDYQIEAGKFSVIICNNVLPFISRKEDVYEVVRKIISGLGKNGAAFLTFYGHRSGFRDMKDMSFFEYEEILNFLQGFKVTLMDRTTTEGYTQNRKGEIIYQHSHRFILKSA